MKQLKDIRVGDKVWVYSDGKVEEYYIIYLNRRDNGSAYFLIYEQNNLI